MAPIPQPTFPPTKPAFSHTAPDLLEERPRGAGASRSRIFNLLGHSSLTGSPPISQPPCPHRPHARAWTQREEKVFALLLLWRAAPAVSLSATSSRQTSGVVQPCGGSSLPILPTQSCQPSWREGGRDRTACGRRWRAVSERPTCRGQRKGLGQGRGGAQDREPGSQTAGAPPPPRASREPLVAPAKPLFSHLQSH